MPDPLQSRTRTGCTVAFLAMPYLVPAAVPVTCVPCPWQSLAVPPLVIASKPFPTRPVKSECVRRMPVSMVYSWTPAPSFA